MVFALNKISAARLSDSVARGELEKEYYAIVHGKLQPQGELIDLLYHDRIRNKSFVVKTERKGAKRAQLFYETLKTECIEGKEFSLVKIKLITGRTHQIRVQFANIGAPLYGDGKYGAKDNGRIHLHSAMLSFKHPTKKENVRFDSEPTGELWNVFKAHE
jgi:23S rRNA pseudouridine1911/1915/1917 synthase